MDRYDDAGRRSSYGDWESDYGYNRERESSRRYRSEFEAPYTRPREMEPPYGGYGGWEGGGSRSPGYRGSHGFGQGAREGSYGRRSYPPGGWREFESENEGMGEPSFHEPSWRESSYREPWRREASHREGPYREPSYREPSYTPQWRESPGGASSGSWRRQRGPYSGRGPSGYQRSDERIREDVNDALTDHPEIDATEVQVRVEQGTVVLEGMVDMRTDKWLAEDLANCVSGVRDVENRLRVRQGASASGRSWASGTGATSQAASTGSTGTMGFLRPRPSMQVFGSDYVPIGEIKEVRDSDFLVDRKMKRDVFVPLGAVQTSREDRVVLNVPSDQVDKMGWEHPSLIGGESHKR